MPRSKMDFSSYFCLSYWGLFPPLQGNRCFIPPAFFKCQIFYVVSWLSKSCHRTNPVRDKDEESGKRKYLRMEGLAEEPETLQENMWSKGSWSWKWDLNNLTLSFSTGLSPLTSRHPPTCSPLPFFFCLLKGRERRSIAIPWFIPWIPTTVGRGWSQTIMGDSIWVTQVSGWNPKTLT